MIPDEAIEAACRAEFSDWDTNGDEWWRGMTRKRVRLALEAAAPHMLAASERVEIGYLCGRGHFVFHGDPDGDACGSKRTAGVYVERDPGVEFYGPYEMTDDDGFVYASGCGYSEDDYAEELAEARRSLIRKIEEWRAS